MMGRSRTLILATLVAILCTGVSGLTAAAAGVASAPTTLTNVGSAASSGHAAALVSPTVLKRTAKRATTNAYAARWEVVHVLGLSSTAARTIDAAVNAEIARQANGFVASAKASPPLAGEPRYTFDERTTLVRSVPGIVGIRIETVQFLGGAHGTPYAIAFNADAATGKRIRIGEVIRTASFPDLAEAARLALQAQMDPDLWDFIDMGTEPKAANYAVWFATPAGPRFVFQAYQVAPYSEGEPGITLPWSEVAPWIRSAAPLAIRAAAGLAG
jgi:hypothetical protein